MIKKLFNGNVLEIYDDIEDLPIDRFMKYNYLLSVDAKLGSDMKGVSEKIDPLIVMADKKDFDNVRLGLINMKQNILMMHENMHPKMMSFAALVKSINGKEYNDVSDAGLMETVKAMSKTRVTWGTIRVLIEELKKKSKRRQEYIFQTLRA